MKNSIGVRLTVLNLIVGLCFISNCSILHPKKMITPEIKALELKESGANAVEAAQVLTSIFGLNKARDLAQILKDTGFNAIQIADMLEKKFNMELSAVEGVLEAIGCTSDEIFVVMTQHWSKKFAPLLLFDKAATTFPMSAQDYYNRVIKTGLFKTDHQIVQNRDPSTLSTGEIPTYYRVFRCGKKGQVRIQYWWFYGYQKSGGSDSPAFEQMIKGGFHNGDWEHIMVILNEKKSRINATTYFAHSGWSTWLHSQHEGDPKHMRYDELGGEHPIVYVGKNAHGSYHTSGGEGTSAYWGDFRNPGSWNKKLETWGNLIDLDFDHRLPGIDDWRDWDKQGKGRWGGTHCIQFSTGQFLKEWCETASGTHPTTDRGVCSLRACSSRNAVTATGIEGLAGGCGGWLDFSAGGQYGKRSDCMVYRQGSYWRGMPWGYDNTCYYNAKLRTGHWVDSYWIDYILPTSDYASGDDLGVRLYGKEPFYWWK
jgi:hypothetical protein